MPIIEGVVKHSTLANFGKTAYALSGILHTYKHIFLLKYLTGMMANCTPTEC